MIQRYQNPKSKKEYTQNIERIHWDIADQNSTLAAKSKANPRTSESTSV